MPTPRPTKDQLEIARLRALNAGLLDRVSELEAGARDERDSERQQREARLAAAASVTLLDSLESSAPVGFALLDRRLRFVRVNDALAAMNGIPASEHENRPVAEVIPALWEQLGALCQRVLDTGEPVVSQEVVGDTAATAGSTGSWLNSLYPVRVADRIVGIGCLVVDVTDRQRAERFRDVVMQTMVEGLYALDGEGRLTFMNAAATRMLGWTEDELRGRAVHELLHRGCPAENGSSKGDCTLLRVRAEGEALEAVEDVFTRRDGSTFPTVYSAAPLLSGSGAAGVVVVFRDATRERAEQEQARRELEELEWLRRTREALDDDRLVLYAQPIVPLRGGQPAHELLLRMLGPDGEIIAPQAFLPVAEEYGLILEIDRWVIKQAARIAAGGRRVHVNISGKSTEDPRLLGMIARALDDAGAAPADVVFELTETALMGDWETGTALARGLHGLGCGLALDDFGTGFGGLTYLKALPIGCLKIDRDFVLDLAANETNQHLVKAVVNLGQALGLETIAEGVEDEEALALLRHYGVDHAQGYYLGRPAPLERPVAAARA